MRKTFFLLSVLCVLGMPVFAFADDPSRDGSDAVRDGSDASVSYEDTNNVKNPDNPLGTVDVNVLIGRITKAILAIIGTISFFVFVVSGIQLIASGGSDDRIKKAKDAMFWALVGIALSLSSYAILTRVLLILTG